MKVLFEVYYEPYNNDIDFMHQLVNEIKFTLSYELLRLLRSLLIHDIVAHQHNPITQHSCRQAGTQPRSLLAGKVADLQNDEQHFEGFGEVTDAPVYTSRKH